MEPVYPRPNPEHQKAVYDQLVRRLRIRGWDWDEDEYKCNRKGRRPKQQQPVQYDKNKARNKYDWFD